MSDIIKPWLWPSIQEQLKDVLVSAKRTPILPRKDRSQMEQDVISFGVRPWLGGSFLQILEISRDQTDTKVTVSDKANTIRAAISNAAVAKCEAKKLERLGSGGILQIHECEISVSPKQSHFALRILDFGSLGGAGSGKFGQPSPIDDLGSARVLLQELDEVQKQQRQQPYVMQPSTEESDADTEPDDNLDDDSDERITTYSQMGYATQVPAPQSKSSKNRKPNVIEPEYVFVINQDKVHSPRMDELLDVRSQAEPSEDELEEDGTAKSNGVATPIYPASKHTMGPSLSDHKQLLSLLQNGVSAPPRGASPFKNSTTPQPIRSSTSFCESNPSLADGNLPSKNISSSPSKNNDNNVHETPSDVDQASHAHHSEQQFHSGTNTTISEKEAPEIQKDTNQILSATEPTLELQQEATQSSKLDTIYTPEKIEAILRIDEAAAVSRSFDDEERHTPQYSRKVRVHIRPMGSPQCKFLKKGFSRISRRQVIIPKNQRELLDHEECTISASISVLKEKQSDCRLGWIPAKAGHREPRANLPSSLLHEHTTRIDQRARRSPHPGRHSHSRQSSRPGTSSSKANSDDSDESEQFATSQDWPPSQHAVTAIDRLPADTPSPAERPPSQYGTQDRGTKVEDSSLPGSPRKRQKMFAREESCDFHSNSPENSRDRTNESHLEHSRGVSDLHELHQSNYSSPHSPSPLANVSNGVQQSFSPTNSDTQSGHRITPRRANHSLNSSSRNEIRQDTSAGESDSDLEFSIPQPLNNQSTNLYLHESPPYKPMNEKMNKTSVLQVTRTPYSLVPKCHNRFVSEQAKASLPRKLLLAPEDKLFMQPKAVTGASHSSGAFEHNPPTNGETFEKIQSSPTRKLQEPDKDSENRQMRSRTPKSKESSPSDRQKHSLERSKLMPLPSRLEAPSIAVGPKLKRKADEFDNNVTSRKKNVRTTKSYGLSQLPPEIEDPKEVARRERIEFFASRRRNGTESKYEDHEPEDRMEIDGQALEDSAAQSYRPTSSSDITTSSLQPIKMGIDSSPDGTNRPHNPIEDQKMHEPPSDQPDVRHTVASATVPPPPEGAKPSSPAREIKVPPTLRTEPTLPPQTKQSTIFEQFKQAYPEYMGNEKHFLAMCRKIEVLVKQDRMEHRSLWDDFIVRQTMEYRQYLLRCSEQADDPIPYEKFYRDEIEEPLYNKRVVTPASLQEITQPKEQGQGENVLKRPSIPQSSSQARINTGNLPFVTEPPRTPPTRDQPLVDLISDTERFSDSAASSSSSTTHSHPSRPRPLRAPKNHSEHIRSITKDSTPSLNPEPINKISSDRQHPVSISHAAHEIATAQRRLPNTYHPPQPLHPSPRNSFPNERVQYQSGPSAQEWYHGSETPYNEFVRAYRAIGPGNGNAFWRAKNTVADANGEVGNSGGGNAGPERSKERVVPKWGTGVSGWQL